MLTEGTFDMIQLGIETLEDAGGDPEAFRQRLEELRQRWAELMSEIGQLQQDVYEAVQQAWKERRLKDGAD